MKKNILRLLIVTAVFIIALTAFAAPADAAETGTCGDDISWEITDQGALYIYGSGDMPDFSLEEPAPWMEYLPTNQLCVNISGDITSIGAYAFYGYPSALTVDMERSAVMTIGEYAFYDCQNLNELRLPESIMSIGSYAFYNCGSLQELPQLDLLMSIGDYAFYYCYALVSLPIGQSTSTIGEYAFSNLEYITSITFPASVTSIGAYAFECCWGLETVTFEGNAPTIHSDAFNNGTFDAYYDPNTEGWGDILSQKFYADITWYAIGGSESPLLGTGSCGEGLTWTLTQDGILTVSGTGRMTDYLAVDTPWLSFIDQITTVVIEDGVEYIGREAFQDCSALSDITMPDSVQGIGAYALDGTAWLDSQPESLVYIGKVLYTYKGTCPETVTLASDTKGIAAMAFLEQTTLETINFPNSLREICFWAFKGCTGLTEIDLNDGLLTIGQNAFVGCNGLTQIVIPNSVTALESGAFGSCEFVEKLVIGDGLASLSYAAFSYCTALTDIEFGSNLRGISNGSFRGCTALERIDLPASVQTIEDSAFRQCTGLKSISMPNVRRISYYAFSNCDALESIDFPETLTYLGESAFSHCDLLTAVTIPDSVTTIDDGCFLSCPLVKTVHIGKGASDIYSTAFANCASLEAITVDPENEYYMSDECGVLYTKDQTMMLNYPVARKGPYTIAETVTKLDWYAFANCTGLTAVTLPDGLERIEYGAFVGCTALKEVVIPDSVTSTWGGTFLECTALEKVWIGDGLKSLSATMFQDCTSLTEVRLPAALEEMGSNTFMNCTSLTSLDLPDTLTEIGYEAFCGCTNLKDIVLPKNLTKIAEGAFYNCDSLEEVYIPDSVRSISYRAFYSCDKLHTVILPKGITCLLKNVLSGCKSLTSIVIPDTVYKIDEYALYQSHSIEIKYTGTEEQWNAITKASNAFSSRATFTYNYDRYGCVENYGVTLKDNIGLTFQMALSEEILNDTGAYVTVSFDGQETIIPAAQAAEDIALDMASAQMTKPVDISISFRHGSTGDTATYTVKQYAEYILSNDYSAETKALAAAMLNYGGKAQKYFSYNTEQPADQDISVTEQNVPASEASSLRYTGSIDGVEFYGASLVYRHRLAVRYYFKADTDPDTLQFTFNGEMLTPVEKDGMYYVEIANILPQDLDKTISVAVTDHSSNVITVQYCPLDYVIRMYQKGSEELKALLQALYTYHITAKEYTEL